MRRFLSTASSRLTRLRAQLAVDAPQPLSFAGAASAGCAPVLADADDAPAAPSSSYFGEAVLPKPAWLRIDTPTGARRESVDRLSASVKASNLATVCEEAKCPNLTECWGGKKGTATATIMLMGDTCTRGCSFCNVKTSHSPPPLDPAEPRRVAESVGSWDVNYVVLTSVDRDELVRERARSLGVHSRAPESAPLATLTRPPARPASPTAGPGQQPFCGNGARAQGRQARPPRRVPDARLSGRGGAD